MSLLEYAVLNALLGVEPPDSFQQRSRMLPHTQQPVLLQNEAIEPALVETFLVPEEAVFLYGKDHWFIPRDFFLAVGGSFCVLHEGEQELLKRVHAFGEVLGESVEDFSIAHGGTADDLFEFGVDELAHQHLPVLYDHHLAVKFVLAEHPVEGLLAALLLAVSAP